MGATLISVVYKFCSMDGFHLFDLLKTFSVAIWTCYWSLAPWRAVVLFIWVEKVHGEIRFLTVGHIWGEVTRLVKAVLACSGSIPQDVDNSPCFERLAFPLRQYCWVSLKGPYTFLTFSPWDLKIEQYDHCS